MKTRLNIITIACVLLFLGACQSKPDGFVLKGELSGAPEGKWIYLTDYDQKVYLDSTQLKDGCFEFQGQLDYPTLCRVTYFKDPAQRTYGWDNILSIPIFLENTAVHLSVPFNEMPAKSQDGMPASLQITGSQAHELYSTYLAAVAPLMMKDDSLFTEYRKAYYYKMGTEEDVFHYVREMDAVRNAIFNTGVAVILVYPVIRDPMVPGVFGQDSDLIGDAVAVPFIFVIPGEPDIQGYPFLHCPKKFLESFHYARPPFTARRRASVFAAMLLSVRL